MANQYQHPLQYLLPKFSREQAEFVTNRLPKSYPAQIVEIQTDPEKRKSNNMVTVSLRVNSGKDSNFPNLEVPVATSRYLRLPLQVGDWGILIPSNYSIQTLIGAEGIVPDISYPAANLSSLIFLPISRFPKNENDLKDKMVWPESDPDTLILSGEKNGVLVQNLWDGDASLALTKDQAALNFKKNSVTLTENSLKASLGNASIKLDTSSLSLKFGGSEITIKDGAINLTGQVSINGQAYLAHTHSNGNMGAPTGGVIS